MRRVRRISDPEEIRSLIVDNVPRLLGGMTVTDNPVALENYTAMTANMPNTRVFGVFDDETIRGIIIGLIFRDPMTAVKTALVSGWAVEPKLRGTQAAILLMAEFMNTAREEECQKISGGFFSASENAGKVRSLYQHLGFEPCSET